MLIAHFPPQICVWSPRHFMLHLESGSICISIMFAPQKHSLPFSTPAKRYFWESQNCKHFSTVSSVMVVFGRSLRIRLEWSLKHFPLHDGDLNLLKKASELFFFWNMMISKYPRTRISKFYLQLSNLSMFFVTEIKINFSYQF